MTRDIIDFNQKMLGTNSLEVNSLNKNEIDKQDDDCLNNKEVLKKITLSQDEIAKVTAKIVVALKTVYDPEIPVDIYELGLIYMVDLEADDFIKITMTLTAPGCPVAGEMPVWIRDAVMNIEGIEKVEVELVFDPPWTQAMMSEEAKLELGWL